MTNVHGLAVVKNERGRYLQQVLEWNSSFLDSMFIYDDDSFDGSRLLAEQLGCYAVKKESTVPSFSEDEVAFRRAALKAMQATVDMAMDDWIYVFDADEFLVSTSPTVMEGLRDAIDNAEQRELSAIELSFKEIFHIDQLGVWYREDGFWDTIKHVRLFKHKFANLFFYDSVAKVITNRYCADNLTMLHFGYATYQDRVVKHERYSATTNHNPKHVASILKPTAVLKRWDGMGPLLCTQLELL